MTAVRKRPYQFSRAMISKADGNDLVVPPTIDAVNDFKLYLDGTVQPGFTNAPALDGAGVLFDLDADEMDAKRVGILCVDAAGDEWADQFIEIHPNGQHRVIPAQYQGNRSLGDTLYLPFCTVDAGGAPVDFDAPTPIISIYKNGTGLPAISGTTPGVSVTPNFQTGYHILVIDTAADPFWVEQSDYSALVTTGAILGQSVAMQKASGFSIGSPALATANDVRDSIMQYVPPVLGQVAPPETPSVEELYSMLYKGVAYPSDHEALTATTGVFRMYAWNGTTVDHEAATTKVANTSGARARLGIGT